MAAISERKTRDGKTVFHVRIRRKGAKTTCATFSRKSDAQKWIHETEHGVQCGKYFERQEGKKHSLKEAIERYSQGMTMDIMRKTHLARWNKAIGFMLLADISSIVVSDVIARIKAEPNERGEYRQASTLNRHLSALSCVFTAAVRDWGWVQRNPVREVRRFKEPRGRIRFLSDDERTRLLVACRESYCPFIYPVVVLALSTGMRKGEIMKLRWPDVELQIGTILLYQTKNGEPRRVAVRNHALEVLRQHAKVRRLDTDLVFPAATSAQTDRPFEIVKAWNDARRKAGLENFVFHDLRHSAASYLAMNGATLLEIAEVLGHKTLDMVRRYSHLAHSHVGTVVERMNEKIFG